MSIVSSVQERVAAGIVWLDTNEPGWVDKIDLSVLDIYEGRNCIGGQIHRADNPGLYSGYVGFIDKHPTLKPDAIARSYGLFGTSSAHGGYFNDCRVLTLEWTKQIKLRRAQQPAVTPEPAPVTAPLTGDQVIDKWADEIQRIVEADTIGEYTWHGLLVKFIRELQATES